MRSERGWKAGGKAEGRVEMGQQTSTDVRAEGRKTRTEEEEQEEETFDL